MVVSSGKYVLFGYVSLLVAIIPAKKLKGYVESLVRGVIVEVETEDPCQSAMKIVGEDGVTLMDVETSQRDVLLDDEYLKEVANRIADHLVNNQGLLRRPNISVVVEIPTSAHEVAALKKAAKIKKALESCWAAARLGVRIEHSAPEDCLIVWEEYGREYLRMWDPCSPYHGMKGIKEKTLVKSIVRAAGHGDYDDDYAYSDYYDEEEEEEEEEDERAISVFIKFP